MDAGAYTYTENKEVRKEFRSMKKHNTMDVDNDNPYLLSEDFGISVDNERIYEEPEPIVMECVRNKRIFRSAFLWKNINVRHFRVLNMDENEITMFDTVTTHEMHDFYFRYHLNVGVEIIEKTASSVLLKLRNENLRIIIETSESYSFDVCRDTISPSYGVLLDSDTIVIHIKTNKDFIVKTIFQ